MCVHACVGVRVRLYTYPKEREGWGVINADVLYGLCAQNFEVDSEHKRESVCACVC